MDENYNTESSLNVVNNAKLGTWHGDSRACEQGQIIYQCPLSNRPINMNEIDNHGNQGQIGGNQTFHTSDAITHTSTSIKTSENGGSSFDTSQTDNQSQNRPIRFTFANSQTIRSSLTSSSESSDSTGSKTTTWGQVRIGSPTKTKREPGYDKTKNLNSPPSSPIKNKNERAMTSWKDVSPTKSSSSSDLERSNHSNKSGEFTNRLFRFTNRMKEGTDSSISSENDQGSHDQLHEYAKDTSESSANQTVEHKCVCKNAANGESPCKNVSCSCSKNCHSHSSKMQNVFTNSTSSISENENLSPKKEKGSANSPDEICDNDYYYEDDFTVQFDTNIRETSVTPIDSDPNTTILDFPNMVTGSYLCFNNGGSSNVSFNNSKASSNVSLNNIPGSHIIFNAEDKNHYDSEDLSGNSGSHNSTMEMSSSERDIMGSSDVIDFSDGPLFTPTPTHVLSTDSLDRNVPEKVDGNTGEMNGSNGSSDTNLNVDCCPKKEEYFLSFDGSHSRVSGSETDISLSFTSHDSCPGHWVHSDSATSHESGFHGNNIQGFIHDRGNVLLSSNEGQEESSDSFHICFNKLSPLHKNNHHYSARENLSGVVLKKLVPVRETLTENVESSEEENTKTSTTLTAGSKDMSSVSPVTSPKKLVKPQPESITKIKGTTKKKIPKSENLYLVGVGKPEEILRKASVHSHTLPRMKKLVSWKQLKGLTAVKKGEKSSVSLPELNSSATTWQTVSAMKCRKLSEISESFHNKRHSASLLEFYQRMKSQSNPVSPESMNNLEQILWPNFIGQKSKMAEMSDSSNSSQEYGQCQCCKQNPVNSGINKAYTNKRIFDWLKMECSSSSRDSNHRPNSLACQTGNMFECYNKETIISPQTVTLWAGTKTVGSQFPPSTKDCGMQTLYNSDGNKICGLGSCDLKKDQALQTSDFEEEEILSLLSENFDDFSFLHSNEGIAKDFLSCPEKLSLEKEFNRKISRSKSADGEYRHHLDQILHSSLKDRTCSSYQERSSRKVSGCGIGRSKSAGRVCSPFRRMGQSNFYTYQSLPDMAFLTSSITLDKEESKESLFDPMKLDLPVPVTIAPKTELEKLNIYQQKVNPVCLHNKSSQCSEGQRSKVSHKTQTESGSSSSGIFTSSASSGTDPAFCECRSRSNNSPENDLERLIFYPPHTELKTKASKLCNGSKRRAHSVPTHLSDCANMNVRIDKYANEVHPQKGPGAKVSSGTQEKMVQISKGKKNSKEQNSAENLYALEEEQTPVASPEQPCVHGNGCHSNCCEVLNGRQFENIGEGKFVSEDYEFSNSDFYNAIEKGKIMIVENDYYRGLSMGLDSTSSSGSSVPNSDRKPLKSCLRKKNRGLRSRSMSAADNFNLNFEELEEKVKNRHSYACDEVYIVSDEHGQLMMYQADDSAEPVMFYLGKDGECHMTEGTKNHLENFGSFPNFDIQVVDSIHGSDSSTERSEGSGNKRKSVSFASEVSFQSISPAISPKKPLNEAEDMGDNPETSGTSSNGGEASKGDKNGENGGGNDTKESVQNSDTEDGNNGKQTVQKQEDPSTQNSNVNTINDKEGTGCHDDQSSTSSSDTPPQEFQITMDTNDNIWTEDLMLEKIGLLGSVTKASDALIAHFAKSKDTFDKLRLGNSTETPEIGDLVITQLCPALTHVIGNRLKHHLAGFQMFGQVTINVWKVVEASVEIVPQTRALCDLVGKVKQTTYLVSYQQKFDAFIFGLLNLRLLDFWIIYIRQKEEYLTKYYESDAILVHADSSLKKHYDDLVTAIQPLAVLPFQLNPEFIREKALTDSKLRLEELKGSYDGETANQNNALTKNHLELTNESPSETTSVLELTASRALSWLASAAGSFPKRKSDMADSRSKSLDSTSIIGESTNSLSQMSGSFSFPGNQKVEGRLTETQQGRFKDAKLSRVDLDPILSPTQSMMKSSQVSQNSFSSFLSTVAAKLDFGKTEISSPTTKGGNVTSKGGDSEKGDNQNNESQSQSMTASATSLVSKLLQLGGGSSSKQNAYKKGVTEYSFEVEQSVEASNSQNKTVCEKDPGSQSVVTDTVEQDCEEKMASQMKQTDQGEKRNSKRVSFDIVNLFDKLLLPQSGKPDTKPQSKIPVPTNRWSWSFGASKTSQPPASSSPIKTPKTQTKSDSEITKKEHFPKKAVLQSDRNGRATRSPKLDKNKTVPPPKPPRLVPSPNGSKKDTSLTEPVASPARRLKKDVKSSCSKTVGTL